MTRVVPKNASDEEGSMNAYRRRHEEIETELASYIKAMQHVDKPTFAVMREHAHELQRRWCRVMGLPEDVLARLEQEGHTPNEIVAAV
jgi:hypothetical protein